MNKFSWKIILAAATVVAAASASAQTCTDGTGASAVLNPSPSFSDLTVTPGTMVGCLGFFDKNQFAGQGGANTFASVNAWLTSAPIGQSALSSTSSIGTWNTGTDGFGPVNFGQTLYGKTLVGVHWGNYGSNTNANVTAFYLFDAGTAGMNTLTVNVTGGWSNAFLYSTVTAVPETETYAMMLAGLGLMGSIARRRKNKAA
jgi:PEP-CTERM motif